MIIEGSVYQTSTVSRDLFALNDHWNFFSCVSDHLGLSVGLSQREVKLGTVVEYEYDMSGLCTKFEPSLDVLVHNDHRICFCSQTKNFRSEPKFFSCQTTNFGSQTTNSILGLYETTHYKPSLLSIFWKLNILFKFAEHLHSVEVH